MACLLADTWATAAPAMEISRCLLCTPAEDVPGQSYERELPLLRAVIDNLPSRPSKLIINGYVWLGATDASGLGAHLFEALNAAPPIDWRS